MLINKIHARVKANYVNFLHQKTNFDKNIIAYLTVRRNFPMMPDDA